MNQTSTEVSPEIHPPPVTATELESDADTAPAGNDTEPSAGAGEESSAAVDPQSEPKEPAAEVNTEQTVTWADVAAASAEAQQPAQPETDVEYVDDVLTIDLSPEDVVKMADENFRRIESKQDLETRLEEEKEVVKSTKTEIDSLTKKIEECGRAMGAKRTTVKKLWRVVRIFATNTEQWIDPATNRVVRERAIPIDERRQQELFPATKATSDGPVSADDIDFGEEEGGDSDESSVDEKTDDQEPENETDDAGGDVAVSDGLRDALESTTNLTGDPDLTEPEDNTEIDALDILESAPNALDPAEEPETSSKKTRKGRR